jgi:hypothetical protein
MAQFTHLSFAGSIDTTILEQPWPKQRVHDYEVGKHTVRWRQDASSEGIFAGATFLAPTTIQETWDMATDYSDLGNLTPEVEKVVWVEKSQQRQVIQMTLKVLWKRLVLNFEIEQDSPNRIRFRMTSTRIGEYIGVCILTADGNGTRLDISTRLNTPVKLPSGLLLWVQRSAMLSGIRSFLKNCEDAVSKRPNLTS